MYQRLMLRGRALLLATIATCLVGIFSVEVPAAASASGGVAQLTIFADGSAIGTQGAIGVLKGHAFIAVRNISQKTIAVGKLDGVAPGETVTVGTWGNKKEHAGVWYNLESYFIHQHANAYAAASLTRQLSAADLAKISTYIARNDSYDAVLKNCSTFASGAWNSVVPFGSKLFAGIPNTPTALFLSITNVGGVRYGDSVYIPWTSRGVWKADGSKKPVRSGSFSSAAPR